MVSEPPRMGEPAVPYIGLEDELRAMGLPCHWEGVEIPNGGDEKEIWKIFDIIFSKLQEGDELYFDLTHAFRYLPMLLLILGNYAHFLRNTVVKSVTYGNWEARDKATQTAPFIDLLPLISLQEWTYAAGQYLETGNVEPLKKVSDSHLKPLLKEAKGSNPSLTNTSQLIKQLAKVVEMMRTCRGISITQGDEVRTLQKLFAVVSSTQVDALNPILDKVRDDFVAFLEVHNGYAAAQWCERNRLYQQAATILEEALISVFALRMGVALDNQKWREAFTGACHLLFWNKEEHNTAAAELYQQLLSDEWFDKCFAELFDELSQLRNDYNHAGMRENPRASQKIQTSLKEIIEKCSKYFSK